MLEHHHPHCDISLLLARQSLYRFAAITLLDPRAGTWDKLDAIRNNQVLHHGAALIRHIPEATPASLARGEQPVSRLIPGEVLQCLPHTREHLNDAYENTFGLLVSNACPPYETEYISGKATFQRSHALADISGFYRAFGLTPSRAYPDRPDHIVLELEFMAYLLDAERRARSEHDNVELGEICFLAQRRFMTEHLSWWSPTFARLVEREDPDGFYGAAARYLAALIATERSILNVPIPNAEAHASCIEHPDACEGCAISP
jgi:TorA maturation chaperone TorD